MIEALGWICSFIVISGFVFNATNHRALAFTAWIVGDIGWIIYDYHIDNYSHALLAFVIIVTNVYGVLKEKGYLTRKENNKELINE